MKITVDWSHTKGLTTYDGKDVMIEDRKSLLQKLRKLGKRGKKSINNQSPTIILEEGCPTSLIYELLRTGSRVQLISNRATEDHRVEHGIPKSDENDARIMLKLANGGARLKTVSIDDDWVQLHSLYRQYCRYQKARVAMHNMKKAYLRQFGDEESGSVSQLSGDTEAYDTAIGTLKDKELSLMKELTPLVSKGESKSVPSPPSIKGLGNRIWAGIVVTANPNDFKCVSSYLRFCGFTEDVKKSGKFNRQAKSVYHMLARMVTQYYDPEFRPIYDKCKADIAEKHPEYKQERKHYAALNRTATMLAKHVFRYFKGKMLEAGE